MHQVLTYVCDYCDTQSVNKLKIDAHEMRCVFNPKNKSCMTCSHMLPLLRGYYQCTKTEKIRTSIETLSVRNCRVWNYTPVKVVNKGREVKAV